MQVVGRVDDRGTLVGEGADQPEDLAAGAHVGARRRLVEEHELRTVHERDRGVQPAPFTSRDLRAAAVEELGQAERVCLPRRCVRRARACAAPRGRRSTAGCRGRSASGTRPSPAARSPMSMSRAMRVAHDVDARDVDGAGVGSTETGDDRDERGLARAVRTEQAEDRARPRRRDRCRRGRRSGRTTSRTPSTTSIRGVLMPCAAGRAPAGRGCDAVVVRPGRRSSSARRRSHVRCRASHASAGAPPGSYSLGGEMPNRSCHTEQYATG